MYGKPACASKSALAVEGAQGPATLGIARSLNSMQTPSTRGKHRRAAHSFSLSRSGRAEPFCPFPTASAMLRYRQTYFGDFVQDFKTSNRFQIRFQDFRAGFQDCSEISRLRAGFQDFKTDFKISRQISGFTPDFKISAQIYGFLRGISEKVYEISRSGGPLGYDF